MKNKKNSSTKKKSSNVRSIGPKDIYETLEADHRTVEDLFKKIFAAYEDEDFEEALGLYRELRNELIPHAHAEDEVFYEPLLKTLEDQEKEEGVDLLREAKEEHHVVELLFKELDDLDCEDDQWKAKLTVLKEAVEHHVEEEEEDMFKKAKKVFSAEEARDLAQQMLELKQSYQQEEQAA